MFYEECVPFAPTLIESMRSIGYSFPTAISDLLDNSISAEASMIEIISMPSSNPELIIIDNGHGMSKKELYEAMRYGSKNPLEQRTEEDLGRFGLGLKSASLSQCRKLTVVSKKNGKVSAYAWDIDYVIASSKWILNGFEEEEILGLPLIDQLYEKESGTYILLQNFDRIMESTSDIVTTFNKYMNDMLEHIALVFHRFLDSGVVISINNKKVEPKDPFLLSNPATQYKREKSFWIKDEQIKLKPYILPHYSKLTQADIDKVGGKERLRNDQGFYVYRNKRLIIWGTWFRLGRKEELSKLARVMVDIPNSLDYMWSIDIKKSTATLPDIIKKNMYSAVYESIANSEEVHTYRGRKTNAKDEVEYIWGKFKIRDRFEYRINREIPQIKMLNELLDDEQHKMLEGILTTIEETFPVNALYVDMAKGNIEEKVSDEKKLWEELLVQIDSIKKNKLSLKTYCEAFMKVEPYCLYDGIRQKLQEVIDFNE